MAPTNPEGIRRLTFSFSAYTWEVLEELAKTRMDQ